MPKRDRQTNSKLPSFWEKYHNHVYGLSSVIGLIAAFAFFFLQPESKQSVEPEEVAKPVREVDLVGNHALAQRVETLLTKLGEVEGVIGLEKKVFGEGLKKPVPVKDWVQGARKEAQRDLDLMLADDWDHLLNKLMKNKYRSDWMLQINGGSVIPLADWVEQNVSFAEPD